MKKVLINTITKAKAFVFDMEQFDSDVLIHSGRYVLDAKSIMAIFSINLAEPLDIEILSEDEEEIIKFNEVIQKYQEEERM